MAGPANSNTDNWALPQRVEMPPAGQPDPLVARYVGILKKASRPEIEATVEKGPSAAAAAATLALSTLKGGWASIKRLWAKTPEDRAFEIYYQTVHGHGPPGFKEKITEIFYKILSVGKSSLATLARFTGIAIGAVSLQKLAGLLEGSRVALLDSRYGPVKKNMKIPKFNMDGRMYLVSRYSAIASPNFGKKLENLAIKTGVKPGSTLFGPRLAEIFRTKTGMVLSPAVAARVAAGELSLNSGRMSTGRYNVIGTPRLFSVAKTELNSLADELKVKQSEILKNPAMAKILAKRLLGRGQALSKNEAAALTAGLNANLKGPNRMTRLRYNDFSVAVNAPKLRAAYNARMKARAEAAAGRQAKTAEEKQKIANRQEQMSALVNALMEGVPAPTTFMINNKQHTLMPNKYGGPITMSEVARGELKKQLQTLEVQKAINLALKYRKMSTNINREMAALGIGSIGNYTSTDDLMRIRERYFNRMSNGLREKVMRSLNSKARRDASALRTLSLNSNRLRSWARHLGAYKNDPYRTDFISSLRNGIQRAANNRNTTTALRRLRQIRSNASGLGVNQNIASAERQILDKVRREQNEKRRIQNANRASRGLAPLPYNRGIPYYPNQPRPRGYGNMAPVFEAPSNRPQYSAVPRPMPQIPPMPIMANNTAGRQALPPMPIENILPPGEKNAVTNVGGANKAINLVENAGGPSNVVKTANILKNVGGSPEAAVAAGANAKNVKIVLQLGGPNNALKVASAVPKLKKRRRSKKKVSKKKVPKPARVKEIKKLLGFLGAKENLQKKLPDKENRDKKLTKKEIVGKLTRFLLRK